MKRSLIFIFLLATAILTCKSQYFDPVELARRNKLTEECNCPNQVFDTDSVYSFLRSEALMPYNPNLKWLFILDDSPMPWHNVYHKSVEQYFYDRLRWYYEDEVPNRKEEIIPPETLRKMISAVLDSTTQYTEPITKWNVDRIGERWINKTSYDYYNDLISERFEDKIYNERGIARKGTKHYQSAYRAYIDLKQKIEKRSFYLSIPVFDEEYKYAFVVFYCTTDYPTFGLYERKESGWAPLIISEGERSDKISKFY